MNMSEKDKDRFYSKIGPVTDTGCWEWAGTVSNGYGVIGINGRNEQASRVAWTLANGPIPDGSIVSRTCGNPLCVNRRHMELTTRAENLEKMRHRGENNSGSKLTSDQVISIRQRVKDGERQAALAREYDVSKNLINLIVKRKSWAHV
jgi:hypothetical protein